MQTHTDNWYLQILCITNRQVYPFLIDRSWSRSFQIFSSYNLYSNNCKTQHFFHLPTSLTYKTIYNITVWHFPLGFSRSLEMGSIVMEKIRNTERIAYEYDSQSCDWDARANFIFQLTKKWEKESKWKTAFFKRNSIELTQQSTEAKNGVELNYSRSSVDANSY